MIGFSHLFDASPPPALQIPASYPLLYFKEVLEDCTLLSRPISPIERQNHATPCHAQVPIIILRSATTLSNLD